jgi:putative nucleotidyltransferase with HDIG domain
MSPSLLRRQTAPRLAGKILGFSFGVIATVLTAVFLLLSWQTRERLSRAILENVETSQARFVESESRRRAAQRAQAATLAENPTLKAAVDTYYSERSAGAPTDQLAATIRRELEKLADQTGAPALAVTDVRGVILASTGPQALDWRPGDGVRPRVGPDTKPVDAVFTRGTRMFLATVVPLLIDDDLVGEFILAAPMDDAHARQLKQDAQTDIAIVSEGRLVATSLAPELRSALDRLALPERSTMAIGGDEFVVRRLLSVDSAQVYALASITAPVREATSEAARVFLPTGVAALLLAGIASLWLARTLSAPIDQLRTTLAQMADSRDFERALAPSGVSFELDALTRTFDRLRAAVSAAEAESEATYLGVIGALAAALDARDPYTAGHSERVAGLSVAIAREMGLPDDDIEVLRLGALLHDIGKIGISDAVLRKPGTLTDDEYEQIKLHPTLGARILRPLNFLAEHLAIVELHHEQPDGRGYPFGLKGEEIPLFARIVHVADAFDAITTARAYRPGRPVTEAMAELWLHAGTGFDLDVVKAIASIPVAKLHRPAGAADESGASLEGGALVPFRLRAAFQARRSAS